MQHFTLVACAALALQATSPLHAKPNILLIIADDAGLDVSRCYDVGRQQAPMPTVENLCETGLVFEQAYSAPVCSPTRATIMTGQYGHRTGIGGVIPKRGGTGLSAEEISLFDVLNTTNYSSTLIGKWHLASDINDYTHPADLGILDFFGIMSGGIPDYYNWQANDNGQIVQQDEYSTTVLTDRSIDWISKQQSPWFLWLAYNAPHTPFHLPPRSLHSFDDLPDDRKAIAANPLPYFNASLEALDTEIGRLLASLPNDIRNNTYTIFIGDNGTPGKVAKSLYRNRGAKGSIFEGGTHIPFIVNGPAITQGRSDALVNTTDLFATISALAGVKTESRDSIDFSPVFTGEAATRKFAYIEHFSDQAPRGPDKHGWAIRDNQFKLVNEANQPPKLFDLSADPLETTDLLTTTPDDATRQIAQALEKAAMSIKNH